MAPKGFGMPELATKPLHVKDRESKDLNLRERLFDPLKFVGLDNSNDQFHWFRLSASAGGACPGRFHSS